MAKPGTGKARRRSANERYRQGFLSQAATELREFALLLTEEPDAQDSVSFELHRLADTAETLELAAVARAANDAAEELTQAGVGVRALRRVANAIRHTGGRLRFGPLILVGVSAKQTEQIKLDAELCCEPVFLFDDLQAFASGLHTEQPTAVVLPAEATDAVGQLVTRENFPVLVHGPPSAWEQHAAAMAAGAHGFLVQPFTLADVTRLARWRSQPFDERFEVLVLADAGEARDQLVQSLQQVGVIVVTTDDPRELAALLETGTPKAVILSATVGGYPALPLAMLVRSHPRLNHLPILVSGRPEDPAALRAIGVDDVMRTDAQPLAAAQRVRDRVVRTQGLAWERDPVTGLANRLGVLNELDAQLAIASRTGNTLSVGLLEVDGLRNAIEAYGSPVVHNVRQVLMAVFRRNLRRTDAVGELAVGELLVAMPNCAAAVAMRRIEEIAELFAERVKGEPQLAGMSLVLGVADTSEGLRTVAVRAERELRGGGTSGRYG
jgi:PleD family two-component response regulator